MKVAVLLFVALFGTAAALQCYQCNSHVSSMCSDGFHDQPKSVTEAFIVDCPVKEGAEEPHCQKQKSYIDGPHGKEIRIDRSCSYVSRKLKEGVSCYKKTGPDYYSDNCQCQENICNGALQLGLTAPLIVLLGAAVLVFERLRSD